MKRLLLTPAAFLTAAALAPVAADAQSAPNGAQVYARCAACHLPTGAGVPGAFPPLGADVRALAGSPAGRRYLVLVVTKGVAGPITVEGRSYRGLMPAQGGLDDAQVAAVLTHVTATVAKGGKGVKPFTAAEVAAVRASSAGITAAAVAKMQPGAGAR